MFTPVSESGAGPRSTQVPNLDVQGEKRRILEPEDGHWESNKKTETVWFQVFDRDSKCSTF